MEEDGKLPHLDFATYNISDDTYHKKIKDPIKLMFSKSALLNI